MEPLVEGVLPICSNGFAPFNKMTTIPIYGKKKPLKNLLLLNRDGLEAECWYIALGTQGLRNFSNDDPRLTFDLLRQGHI